MAVRGEHRIKKLESDLLKDLSPTERVNMVLTAVAAGDKDQAQRIGKACPMKSYRMADAEYVDRLDDLHSLSQCATVHFRRYVLDRRLLEALRDYLCNDVTALVASRACTLSVAALLSGGGDDNTDWAKVDKAEEEAKKGAASTMGRMLDALCAGIRCRARADWKAFDTVSRERMGLDAWTLLKGSEMPEELIEEIRDLLASESVENEGEPNEGAFTEALVHWRAMIQR